MTDYRGDVFTNKGERFSGGEIGLLQQSVQFFGERPFLIDDKCTYSFLETERISARLSRGLSRLGIRQRDRVILYLEGGAEFAFSRLALRKLGAVIIPLNNDLSVPEIRGILSDVQAEWVIVSRRLLPVLQETAFPGLSGRVIVVGEVPPNFKAESYRRLLEEGGSHVPLLTTDLNSDAVICYTSGTTGRSKGVVYRHRNTLASGIWMAQVTGMQSGDVLLTAIPMYVSSNFNGYFLASLMQGVSVVLLKRFNPKDVLAKIEAHRVTIFHATGNMYVKLLNYKNFSNYNLSSLRMVTWSNILPTILQQQLRMAFPSAKIMQFYGFAEGGPVGTYIKLQDLFQRPGSCGKIDPEFACFRVVDEKGSDVSTGEGEIGEIIYQSPGLMRAYYRNPQATAKAIRNGWYYTGDLGRLDQDGFLYIVGRNKDIINYGGKRVYPLEVEEVLFKHPAVLDVAVIGAPHTTLGKVVVAFVVLKEGNQVTADELIAYCQKANLPPYKIPGKIEFRKTFPKNSMGKTLKNELI
jgi:acyl-CoA synthetase (AMP-forming)/AMP-acid ligase II